MVSPSIHTSNVRRLAVIAALIFAAACSGSDSTPSAPTSTAQNLTTSQPAATTPTSETPVPAERVAAAWTEAWPAASNSDAQPGDLSDVTDEVADRLIAILHPERADGATAAIDRSVRTSPSVAKSETDPNAFVIDDCLLISPAAAVGEANYYRGTATVDGDGSVTIESVEPVSLTGCVAADVAADVLDAYQAYWEAVTEISDPPDPDSPLLSEVAIGDQLDLLVRNLTDFESRGLRFVDDPVLHPEIIEWRNAKTVVVLDCQEADPDYGLFDGDGNRQPETPPVADDEVDLREFTMVLDAGKWKVADRQGSSDTDCDFAPTEFGVPVV